MHDVEFYYSIFRIWKCIQNLSYGVVMVFSSRDDVYTMTFFYKLAFLLFILSESLHRMTRAE